jgi:hypothetical protein
VRESKRTEKQGARRTDMRGGVAERSCARAHVSSANMLTNVSLVPFPCEGVRVLIPDERGRGARGHKDRQT